jgi:hypothetical protein
MEIVFFLRLIESNLLEKKLKGLNQLRKIVESHTDQM